MSTVGATAAGNDADPAAAVVDDAADADDDADDAAADAADAGGGGDGAAASPAGGMARIMASHTDCARASHACLRFILRFAVVSAGHSSAALP